MPAFQLAAQTVVASGDTATTVTTAGTVADVTTGTVSGGYGVNSFSQFNVVAGNTVNIHAPTGTAGTVNVITGGRSAIDGAVRGLTGGAVGGELYIANPDGFTVGPDGSVVAGRVGLSTPTAGFADSVFGSGGVDDAAVASIVDGSSPQSNAGIDVQGRVAGGQSVRLRTGGNIDITGTVEAGDRAAVMASAVNLGSVTLDAGGDITLGTGARLTAGGTATGGSITLNSGGVIRLDTDAIVNAEGLGLGDGGVVTVFAQNAAYLGAGSVISAAALGPGDGGSVEFSAADLVDIQGDLRAWSAMGLGGTILIDRTEIIVSADVFTGGANYILAASDRIEVAGGVTVSTRNIGTGTDHFRDASVGDSGNITLEAPEIVISPNAALLAFADGGFQSGAILLDAHVDDAVDLSTAAFPTGKANINVQNAILWGGDVTLRSRAIKDNILSTPGMVTDYVNDTFGTTGIGIIDRLIGNLVGQVDASVANLLAGVDAANLPGLVSSEALTHVAGSYIIASGDARFTSRAETSVTLDPADASLAVAIAVTDTVAETILQDNYVFTGGNFDIRATVRETQRLAAGGNDPDTGSNMAMAISLRESRARALLVGSTYNLPVHDFLPADLTRSASIRGDSATIAALSEKDITIRASSGGNDDGAGEALIISRDNSDLRAAVATDFEADDSDVTIDATTRYLGYELTATVDEDALPPAPAADASAVDAVAALVAPLRGAIANALGGGSIIEGAALVLDQTDSVTHASFGTPIPYTNILTGGFREGSGGRFYAMRGGVPDLASMDTVFAITALTDLGSSAVTATVGTQDDEGLSAGGTAILSNQTRETLATNAFGDIENAPALLVEAKTLGGYSMAQSGVGGADVSVFYGRLLTDLTTRARVKGQYFQSGNVTVQAREDLLLENSQSADLASDKGAGSLGFARTDYGSVVEALITDSALHRQRDAEVTILADSLSTIETMAMRSGDVSSEGGLQLAAATALFLASGKVRAAFVGTDVESDALTIVATDDTWRHTVANSMNSGGGTSATGAAVYDEYRRDTLAEIENAPLFDLANGVTVSALSATHSSLVSIGRSAGGNKVGASILGALVVDDRNVAATVLLDFTGAETFGDMGVTAARDDSVILVQGTEASSSAAAGVALGAVFLGGKTLAEVDVRTYTPPPEEQFPGWEAEFPPVTIAGDLSIAATNATRAIDITLGGGSTSNFGGVGSVALLDMGHLAADTPVTDATDALLDGGSERATYQSETDAVVDSFTTDFIAAGDHMGGGTDPLTRQESVTSARLAVSGGIFAVDGAVDVSATDRRSATAVAGQLQAGIVNAATSAFDTYFSIDDISENGVTLSLRPETVGEAITTAQDVISTGRRTAKALGDFSDAISNGGGFSTGGTTLGAAAAIAVIGGSVLAEIDHTAADAFSIAGTLDALGAVTVNTSNEAGATAVGFGMQIGSNSIGGSVSHSRLNQLSVARLLAGTLNGASLDVAANNTGRTSTIGGILAVANSQAAVGVTVTLADLDAATLAEIDGVSVATASDTSVLADDVSRALSVALAGGGSAGFGALVGSIGVSSQRALVRARVGNSTLVSSGGKIEALATQNALTNALVAQGSSGGTLAAGAALADVTLRSVTEALTEGATLETVAAGKDIVISATSSRVVNAAAVGAAAGGTAGVTGSFSLITREDALRAVVSDSTLDARDSILVEALAEAAVGSLGGGEEGLLAGMGAANINLAAGGTVGIGVSVSSLRSAGVVEALVTGDSTLTSSGIANGNGVSGVRRDAIDDYAERADHTYQGVAVVADNITRINTLAMSASLGGTVAISVQVPVTFAQDRVTAMIEGGQVTAETDVNVFAGNASVLRLLSFAGQASGAVSGGADIEVIHLDKTTEARVTDADLVAGRDVSILAVSPEDMTSWSASLSVSANVSAAGVVQTLLAENTVTASLDGGTVTAEGNLDIAAHAPRALNQNAANVTISGQVGVGGTVLSLVARDEVLAEVANGSLISSAVLDVDDDVTISATSDLTFRPVVVGGSAGLVAISGAIYLARIDQAVTARLGNHASMDLGRTRSLAIDALLVLDQNATVGNFTGGGAAIGGAVLSLTGGSSVLAEIGDFADVATTGTVSVEAESRREINGLAAAIGGGGLAFQGSAVLAAFGEKAEDEEVAGTLDEVDADQSNPDTLDFGAGDATASDAMSRALAARQAAAAARDGAPVDGVTARVGIVAEVSADSILVDARETGTLSAVSGAASLGTGAFAAGFTRVDLYTNVLSQVDVLARLETSGGSIDVLADSGMDTGNVRALAGAGGAVSGFGAAAEAHVGRTVSVDIGSTAYLGDAGAGAATITLEASEDGQTNAEADGGGIGAVAVGGVFATARNVSTVSVVLSSLGQAMIDGGDIAIAARRTGTVEAIGIGLAGGVVAGAGVDVAAHDDSVTSVELGLSALIAAGAVDIAVTGQAEILAKATGAQIGLATAGITLARAERTAAVTVTDSGAQITANSLELAAFDALSASSADASSVTARTISATGGAAASIGGALTTLINDATVDVALNLSVLDIAGDATLSAGTNSVVLAKSTGLNLGFVAIGANIVDMTAASDASLALSLAGPAEVAGDLALSLSSADDVTGIAVSGTGGIYSAQAADSSVDIGGDTALMLDGGAGLVVGGEISAETERSVTLDSHSNSLEASLAGFGGTRIRNTITTDNSLTLAGSLTAGAFDVDVISDVTKIDDGYSGKIGSAGVLDGTSLLSDTNVTVSALLEIADGADLAEIGPAEYYTSDATFAVTTFLDLDDSVKIDTGGGILIPSATSSIDAEILDAAIRVGDANVVAAGSIDMSVLAETDISTEAYVSAYGVAGVPYAEATSDYDANQSVEFSAGATVRADKGSVRVNAGSSELGGQVANVSSELRVWNATVLPIGRTPYARSTSEQTNTILVDAGASILAGNDVELTTGGGLIDTYSYGLASDLYREAAEKIVNTLGDIVGAEDVSLDTEVGVTTQQTTETVTVNGFVEAGTHYLQQLTAGNGGIETISDGIDAEYILDADVRAGLQDALDQLNADLAVAQQDPILAARLESEIARLESIIASLGTSPINILRINDAYASAGDIEIVTGTLTGTGSLLAHGDATIEIVNTGPAIIELVNATIPYRGGGLVTLNGLPQTAASAPAGLTILASSSATVAAQPVISAENHYASATGISGNIHVLGAVENLRGRVSIHTAAGDVMVLGGTIDAAEVDISSGGDFFLSAAYDDAVTNLPNSPYGTHAGIFEDMGGSSACVLISCNIPDLTDPAYAGLIATGGEIIAQGGVFIYANNSVNITGLIQSGVTDYVVAINDNIGTVLDGMPDGINVLYSPAGNGTSPAEDPLFPAASGNVTLRYDSAEGVILVDPIIARGGQIEIVGQIISTGGGVLSAAHGYAQVDIVNESDVAIVLNDLSTGLGDGAQGHIRIVDLSRPAVSGSGFVTTEYTLAADGNVARTVSGLTTDPFTMFNSPTYEIETPWRLVYASGDVVPRADGTYELGENPGALQTVLDSWLEIGVLNPGSGEITQTSSIQENNGTVVTSTPYFDEFVINADDTSLMAEWDAFLGVSLFGDLIRDNDYVGVEAGVVAALDPYDENVTDWSCAGLTCTRLRTQYRHTSNYDLHILAADKTIDVGFHGHDTGRIDITSVGDVIFDGTVYNRSGPTTIVSSGGSIYANSAFNPFQVNKLTLDAAGDIVQARVYGAVDFLSGGGIGGPFGGALGGTAGGQPSLLSNQLLEADAGNFRIDQAEGFGLDVVAGGDARIEEIVGDMELLSSWAVGDLRLTAANSILEHRFATSGVLATGDRVKLTTGAGSIGTLAAPITFDAQVINAEAGGDINLLTESDLPVRVRKLISQTGNVSLVSTISSIWDDNKVARVDRRASDGLLEALWDELGLRAVDSAGNPETERAATVIGAFEAAERSEYFEYWNHRRQIATGPDGKLIDLGVLPYDPDFAVTFSDAEIFGMTQAGLDATAIALLEKTATDRFHALHAKWGGTGFDAGFVPAATAAQVADLTAGQHWNDAQLGIGLRNSLVLATTDTEPTVEAPNIVGHDVNIVSGASIGRDRNPLIIDRTAPLTEDALLDLWTAERSDLTLGPDTIEVARRDDIDIEATGHLFALAPEDVLIGSEIDINILFASAGDDLRIKSGGALTRVDGATAAHLVKGTDIVLEAAAGGIGALGDPLLLDQLAGGSVVARAEGVIRLTAPTSDMSVAEVFSDAGVVLAALTGSILDAGGGEEIDILADSVALLAGTSIGAPGDPLELDIFGAEGNLSALALAGTLDIVVAGGDVTAGLIGALSGDASLTVQAGNLTLFGLGDPALVALFPTADLAAEETQTGSLLDGLQDGLSGSSGNGLVDSTVGTGPAAPQIQDFASGLTGWTGGIQPDIAPSVTSIGSLIGTQSDSIGGRLAASGLLLGTGGVDAASSADLPLVPALLAGGLLSLDVSGSVIGRTGAALDMRAVDGADLRVGGSFGSAGNYILARIDDGLTSGNGATLALRDHDRDDGLAPHFYLANLARLELTTANLTDGESTLRLMTQGDLRLGAGARLRGGSLGLAALGDNPEGTSADIQIDTGATVEADALALLTTGTVDFEGTGGLILTGTDLTIVTHRILTDAACTDCGAITLNGGDLSILSKFSVELDAIDVGSGTARILTTELGAIRADMLTAGDVQLTTRLGDIDIGNLTATTLRIDANGSVLPGVFDVSGTGEIDALAIGRDLGDRLVITGPPIPASWSLQGEFGVLARFEGAPAYVLSHLGAGPLGLGVGIVALHDGIGALRLKQVDTQGTEVAILADAIEVQGDITSGGGDISLLSRIGAITMQDFTAVDAGNGHISVISAGDAVISSLTTVGLDPDAPMIILSAAELLTGTASGSAHVFAGLGSDARVVVEAGAIGNTGPGGFWIEAGQLDVAVSSGDLHLGTTMPETTIQRLQTDGGDIEFLSLGEVILQDAVLISEGLTPGNIAITSVHNGIAGSIATAKAAELRLSSLGGALGDAAAPVALPTGGIERLVALAALDIGLDVNGDLMADAILSESAPVTVTATGTATIALLGGSQMSVTSAANSVQLAVQGQVVPSLPPVADPITPSQYRDVIAGLPGELTVTGPGEDDRDGGGDGPVVGDITEPPDGREDDGDTLIDGGNDVPGTDPNGRDGDIDVGDIVTDPTDDTGGPTGRGLVAPYPVVDVDVGDGDGVPVEDNTVVVDDRDDGPVAPILVIIDGRDVIDESDTVIDTVVIDDAVADGRRSGNAGSSFAESIVLSQAGGWPGGFPRNVAGGMTQPGDVTLRWDSDDEEEDQEQEQEAPDGGA